MSTKFVLFTNAATKEPILVNADHVRAAHQVTGHRRVKLLMDGENAVDVEGDFQTVGAKLMRNPESESPTPPPPKRPPSRPLAHPSTIKGLRSFLRIALIARAEHDSVLTERDRLADEMERMAEPIMQIAHLVVEIEAVDRVIGRLNATSALQHGHIAPVLIGSAPAVQVLFADALIWDGFAAVAKLTSKAA